MVLTSLSSARRAFSRSRHKETIIRRQHLIPWRVSIREEIPRRIERELCLAVLLDKLTLNLEDYKRRSSIGGELLRSEKEHQRQAVLLIQSIGKYRCASILCMWLTKVVTWWRCGNWCGNNEADVLLSAMQITTIAIYVLVSNCLDDNTTEMWLCGILLESISLWRKRMVLGYITYTNESLHELSMSVYNSMCWKSGSSSRNSLRKSRNVSESIDTVPAGIPGSCSAEY